MELDANIRCEEDPDGRGSDRCDVLEVRDLKVSYAGDIEALRGASLGVPEGSVAALLGNNGAGKSTLLRAISGTLNSHGGTIDAGSIQFSGRDLKGTNPADIVRAGVVQVPEGRRIFGDLTVEENLRAGALATRDRAVRARARARVDDLFPILNERRSQRAGLLSGGEQQMLAIGRGLMATPRVLLLDEPSLGLAPQMVDRIGEIIREINRQGTTVMLVEQNAALALGTADLAYVLELGRTTVRGPAAELAKTDEVRDRYLAVGSSRARPNATKRVVPDKAPTAAAELRVDGLTVRFGGITALKSLSFSVKPGSIHALIGPNGAGKSTCLNVLSGIYSSTEGAVRYGGDELTRLRPDRIAGLGLGRTFQNLALSPTATVADSLLLGRHRLMREGFVSAALRPPATRRERRRHEARVRDVAELVDLAECLDREVHTLSYGARKRVELGRALCTSPTLLLLDEPVAGMTQIESVRMAETIATVRTEFGVSIVVVEHDMSFVMGISDRVTVLDFGRKIAEGTPASVQRDPEVLRAYLGSSGDVAAGPVAMRGGDPATWSSSSS